MSYVNYGAEMTISFIMEPNFPTGSNVAALSFHFNNGFGVLPDMNDTKASRDYYITVLESSPFKVGDIIIISWFDDEIVRSLLNGNGMDSELVEKYKWLFKNLRTRLP